MLQLLMSSYIGLLTFISVSQHFSRVLGIEKTFLFTICWCSQMVFSQKHNLSLYEMDCGTGRNESRVKQCWREAAFV